MCYAVPPINVAFDTLSYVRRMKSVGFTREIERLRTDLCGRIEILRRDIVVRLGGSMIASFAGASALMTLFVRAHGG
jgi:hypothetical protein